jgi:hypothetical protein
MIGMGTLIYGHQVSELCLSLSCRVLVRGGAEFLQVCVCFRLPCLAKGLVYLYYLC